MRYIHTHQTAKRYRSIWISDVHLGFPGCSANYLLDFLRSTKCDYLYLVGDIIDVWYMKKRMYWPQEHNNVIRTILGKAKHGTKVIYIPGNHDEIFRDYVGLEFGNIKIKQDAIHTMVDGKRFLVSHGDEFDTVVQCSPVLAIFGSKLYDWLLYANRHVNYVLRKLGYGYWSLASFLKHKVKNAVQYIGNFEHAVMYAAVGKGVDGYICGHIHRPEISKMNTIMYCNTGDWVESCSALVEKDDGTLEILYWTEEPLTMKNSQDILAAA